MSAQPITLAFAGSADTDIENVKALLNDFVGLGDEDADGYPEPSDRAVTLVFPVTRNHLSEGLETVLDWSEYADLPYVAVADNARSRSTEKYLKDAQEVVHAANVTAGVVDLLKKADSNGEEVYLILLWGDEGSEEAELLLDAAEQAGIKAKDLTAGLDDISFGEQPQEEPEEEPEPEPEPEPEAPKRGRRRGRKAEPEEAEPEEEPLTEDEPQEEPRRGRRARKAEPEQAEQKEDETLERQVNTAAQKAQRQTPPVPNAEIDLLLIGTALEGAYKYLRLEDERNALANQADEVRERPLTELLAKALHIVADAVHDREAEEQESAPESEGDGQQAEEPKRRRRGRPRDESKTYAFLVDEDGNYSRRGRGRIPAGQKVVHLTRAEIEEKGLELDGE